MLKEMINKENLTTGKAGISYLEILILIVSLFAVSYIFYKITDSIYDVSNNIGMVNAQKDNICCEELLNGQSCQTAPGELCNPSYRSSPTNCESTVFCEVGCCISENTGLCSEMTSKRDCEKINGTFKSGKACNVQECKKGCCILGDQAKWTTEKNCQFEGNSENKEILTEWGLDVNSDTEVECLFSVEKDKQGACVFDSNGERKCVFTTLEECVSRTGSEANFDHEGKFCSDPALETICKAKDHKNCVKGEEDVYWFDSCGNKEDIAEDCNLVGGSYCGKDNNNYFCRDVNCVIDGVKRKNGESWCTYDGKIGNGKDPAGSRHVKHICYLGTERIAPCSDFRNEICVQEDTLLDTGESFSQAACRVNQWRTCLSYNNEKGGTEKMVEKCNKNPDCRLKNIDMAGSFNFKVCLPNYPPGFELNLEQEVLNEDGSINEENYFRPSSADDICSTASQRCTETWRCTIFGCTCIDNCKCHTAHFTSEMNDFCVSLGDCGAYINYIGDYSDIGYSVRVLQKGEAGPPRLSKSQLTGFSKFAGPQSGQKPASPGNFEFFNTLNPDILPEVQSLDQSNLSAFERELLAAAGAYGSPFFLKALTSNGSVFEGLDSISAGPISLSRFTNAISSTRAAIDNQIDRTQNEQAPDLSSLIAMIASLITYVITQNIIVAMVAALLGFLFGISWIKYVDIDFSCLAWEPPEGGDKCNECNKLDVPCTDYRCDSLGTLCHLINKGTENELCVSMPANETLPLITPFENAISEGYKYHNIGKDGFEVVNASNNGCIEPYTSVDIGIKIDPFARCRWSNSSKDNFEDMYELFGPKGNYILPIHLTKLFFPNPEAFRNVYNLTDAQIEELGKLDLFVKCRTATGKENPEPFNIKTCINPGPDLTTPRITLTSPFRNIYISYGIDEKLIKVYVNEPSQCRWSVVDKAFNDMENQMACETNPAIFGQFGWACNTTLTNLSNIGKFYFRCRDTSDNKNTMVESYVYELFGSKSKLMISEILPKKNERIISGNEPVSAKLRLKTTGGAKSGEAVCRWEGNGYGDSFSYQNENGSTSHTYDLLLRNGGYNLNLFCGDVAGNIAENSTSFSVRIDKFGPTITRIYYDLGLKITTSENAECAFSFKRNTNYENSTKMSGNGLEHQTIWQLKTYYVQCQDEYGNKGAKVRIKPIS